MKNRNCPYCKQEIKIKTGVHNFKNLFRKPTFDDFITLFIILMVMFAGYVYKQDITSLNDYYTSGDYCKQEFNLNNSKEHSIVEFLPEIITPELGITFVEDEE